MKERLSVREAFFVIISRLSPFGTVRIKPLRGLEIDVENLPDEKAPLSEGPKIDEMRRVIIPKGSSVRVHIKKGDSETHLKVDVYRERPGHTHGAKIRGEGVDVDLNSKRNKVFIPGVGYTEYRK